MRSGKEKQKILLVDDSDPIRDALNRVLESEGFEVVPAASVPDALKLIAAQPFDAVLSDLHMPDPGDGLTVVSAMRHFHPGAATIIFSGHPDLRGAAEAILNQADHILVKPMPAKVLVKTIRERLKMGTIPPRVTASVATILEEETQATIADWMNACVAVERVVTVILGINFDKTKSQRAARWVILAVPLFIVASVLHDPIHRDLIDDEEEGRTWCVVHFTPAVEIFNSVMNIFHFIIPFLINFILAIIIVVGAARKRSSVKKEHTYKENVKQQFHHHKHLILSPIVLAILALPRLVISFMSGCMKSPRDPTLYLAGYFISFIPPLLTFFIFVLPSKMYRKEFDTLIRRRWKAFRRRLNLE